MVLVRRETNKVVSLISLGSIWRALLKASTWQRCLGRAHCSEREREREGERERERERERSELRKAKAARVCRVEHPEITEKLHQKSAQEFP